MIQDPVVEEVRAARDAFAKEHGYDIGSIFAALRELEAGSERESISLSARHVLLPTTGGTGHRKEVGQKDGSRG